MATISEVYKITLYFLVLDAMIGEFQNRFGNKNLDESDPMLQS